MTTPLILQPILECISGPDKGRSAILLPQVRLVAGRNPQATIPLTDPQTAHEQLSILFDGQHVYFQTIGTESVELNNRVATAGELTPAADLCMGSSHWRLLMRPSSAGATPISPFSGMAFSRSVNRISTLTGVDTLDSDFSLKTIFAKVGGKRTDEEIESAFTVGTPQTTPVIGTIASQWPQPWLFIRFGGSALLVFIALFLAVTQFENELLIPGLLFVGSFVVPFASLIFFWEMNAPQNVSLYQTIKLLFSGGMVSLLISLLFFNNVAFLQTYLGASSAGIVEESGKLLAVLLLMRTKNQYHWILNGLLFGAAVGTGFAAFESSGYAFVVLLQGGFGQAVSTIFLRGVLAPFSHVVWTAITAAAVWRVKGERPFAWNMLNDKGFQRPFIAVVILHMTWNAPFEVPILPYIWLIPTKQLILGTVAWIMVLGLIQSGLKQIKKAQQAVLQPAAAD